jgi:hypothetical protein
VLAPSVSKTIASLEKPGRPRVTRAPVGAIVGSACAIESREIKMPWPIAVPKEVDRARSTASSRAVSVVGGTSTAAVPAKATSPTRGPPACDLMKSAAACSAAVMRLGCTSVEHMDPETSRASMIVVDVDATGTDACGRAAPIPRMARPPISSAAGMRRRQLARPATAARTSAMDDTRTATRRRLRRHHHRIAASSGMAASVAIAHGQENDIRSPGPR